MAKTYLFWDPLEDNIVQERDETGALLAEYTTEPGLYGNVISQNRGGVERQYHYDAIGSTLALTDDSQQVTDIRAYSAFGETTEETGATVFPFQYIGQSGYYLDIGSVEYLIRHRAYSHSNSRWISTDPIGALSTSVHLYVYVSNRPLILTDPSGMWGADSASTAVKLCMKKKTKAEKIRCLENLMGTGKPDLEKECNLFIKIIECESIHQAYSALKCNSCKAARSRTEANKNAVCFAAEVGGRTDYLNKACDYVLPGSIAKGSKVAETAHQIERAKKALNLAECLAKTRDPKLPL